MNDFLQFRQLLYLIIAYFKELIREPGVLFWGIGFPILMSLGLGVAFTKKPDMERTVAVVLQQKLDDSSLRIKLDQLGGTATDVETPTNAWKVVVEDKSLGKTSIEFISTTWEDAMVQLKRGSISLVMDEQNGIIAYHFDPTNPDAQLTYLKLIGMFSFADNTVQAESGLVKPLTVSGTRYIDFLIPGLIAMGVMTSCMWGLGYGIIDKRAKKLMRRMVATPMKKSYFLFSLIVVRIAMNVLESGLLFLFAWMVFDIRIQGNLIALAGIFMAGNLAFSGIAVFIASRTGNTEIGNGLINAIVFPLMLLSGIFFSYHNFPDWSLPIIQKLPLTMFADGIRSIFIEGAGLADIMGPCIILLTIGSLFFVVGLKVFKWY